MMCRGSAGFFANETWLEQYIDATETFGAINVDVSVKKLIVLERSVVNSRKWLEQHFDATETFSTDSQPLCRRYSLCAGPVGAPRSSARSNLKLLGVALQHELRLRYLDSLRDLVNGR